MYSQTTADDLVALRHRQRLEQNEKLRQRIRGIRGANPAMSLREIAYRIGVSLAVVEQALGVKAAPEVV